MGTSVKQFRPRETFGELISRQLEVLANREDFQKNQTEIAIELGFASPNFLTMIKKGKSKMPLHRVSDLANLLGMDFDTLFLAALRQYYDEDTIAQMQRAFLGNMSVPEVELLDLARTQTNGHILTPETKRKIAEALRENNPRRF